MFGKGLFNDKVALVTGGRSGIGYGIAKQYLELGAKVIIASRKEEPLAAAAKELSEHGNCISQACDIRELDQIEALADRIEKEFGRLDILVNNAGGQFPTSARKLKPKGWNAVINNNLNGTFYMSQAMANRFFIPQKEGNILNIIVTISRGLPGMIHTGAARAGVDNMTKTLCQEWAEYNIRVNAVAPGVIDSSGLGTYPKAMDVLFDELKKESLMGRLGAVEDVANAVSFLTSPLSSYVNGVTLYVDGADHLSTKGSKLYDMIKGFM